MRQHKFSKLLKCFFIGVSVTGMVATTGQVASANEWKDTKFDFYYNEDGSDVATKARNKTDNSKSYVKCGASNPCKLNVCGAAKTGVRAGSYGDAFDYDYSTNVYQVAAGKSKYFTNNSKKYKTTYLLLSTTDHLAHTMRGVWSPDNCSGK